MLDEHDNRVLTQVGPGSPMGELMRRYWHPIAAIGEMDEDATKALRLMGEDLVLYKDRHGTFGLLDLHCAHRRADLSYGYVEDVGLRCNYHGWLYDESGLCLVQPFEDLTRPEARFKDRIKIKAYPVEARAGLLWAYLGPQPAPLVPDWDVYHDQGYKQIVISHVPANWLQCQENSIDPVHFEWLHSNWAVRLQGQAGPYTPVHVKIGFEEIPWGFTYKRVRSDTTEQDPLWTVGRVCLWPNCLYTGHFEWRVPIDDDNTLSVGWFIDRVPGDAPFEQENIPYWYAPIKDPSTGRWISSHVMNQDYIAWVGQGTIADRGLEHLGDSDRGVILMRKRMLEQIELVADGGEPMAVIRDPAQNHEVPLPRIRSDTAPSGRRQDDVTQVLESIGLQEKAPAPERPNPFPFLAGQPAAIREEMEQIWAARSAMPPG